MIFPNLELEAIVQLGDRTRLSALKSFVTQNEAAISLVQINTGTGLIRHVRPLSRLAVHASRNRHRYRSRYRVRRFGGYHRDHSGSDFRKR